MTSFDTIQRFIESDESEYFKRTGIRPPPEETQRYIDFLIEKGVIKCSLINGKKSYSFTPKGERILGKIERIRKHGSLEEFAVDPSTANIRPK